MPNAHAVVRKVIMRSTTSNETIGQVFVGLSWVLPAGKRGRASFEVTNERNDSWEPQK